MTAPKRFPDRDEIAAVRLEAEPLSNGEHAATTRRVAGRVMARRDMGKLVFLDLDRPCRRKSALRASTFSGYVEPRVCGRGRAKPAPAASAQ